MSRNFPPIHGTTVLCVRRDNKVVIAADGQVTMGEHVMKHTARKTRRLFNEKIPWRDLPGRRRTRFPLFERFEGKLLQEHQGNLWRNPRSSWRRNGGKTARCGIAREALLIVADPKSTFLVSGNGDVIEAATTGSARSAPAGPYALAAAWPLSKHTKMSAKEIGAGGHADRQRNLHFHECEFHD